MWPTVLYVDQCHGALLSLSVHKQFISETTNVCACTHESTTSVYIHALSICARTPITRANAHWNGPHSAIHLLTHTYQITSQKRPLSQTIIWNCETKILPTSITHLHAPCLNLWFNPFTITTHVVHLNRSKWTLCVFAYHCQLMLRYFVYSRQRYRSYCFTQIKMWENWPWIVQLISEPSSRYRPLPVSMAETICHLVVALSRMGLVVDPCRPHQMCST